ncbi:MAG: hypothetical protein K2L74_01190, partial [Muribaculaceae bacterium]|nr:hypothetical protein [Muribaculaceae bacterium]
MTDVRRFCLVAVALVALLASCGGSDAGPQAIAPVYAQFAGYAPGEPVTPEMQACMKAVSYSNLTLPTNRDVFISVVGVS